jgi:hypothetical protein
VARFAFFVALSFVFAGCGGSSDDGDMSSPPDLSDADLTPPPPDLFEPDLIPLAEPPDLAGADLVGYPAAHAPLPQLKKHDNLVLSNTRFVTVTYDDDPNRPTAEAFGAFIFASSYYKLFQGEYGYGGGMQVATVHLPGPTPLTQKSSDVLAAVRDLMDAGMAPAPTDTPDDQVVYAFWIKDGAKLDDGINGASCNDYLGYHSSSIYAGQHFPYMVIADCGAVITDATATASHEVLETVSDPYGSPTDGWYLDQALPDHWYADTGSEVADMCDYEDYAYEGGFALQPSWSNAAAASGKPPCLPETSWPYYGFDVSPATAPTVAAGADIVFTITGWSMFPRKNWSVTWNQSIYSDLTATQMKPSLSTTHLNNGDTLTIKLTCPAGATSGQVGAVDVMSNEFNNRLHPVAFIVQ